MKSRSLLMVTTGFPYGHGESFVDAELAHMDQVFETITLVPCFFTAEPPRAVRHPVELAYARARWGAARIARVLASFTRALWRYQWLGEACFILRQAHRLENLKELVRSLYRARLFEQFLEAQFGAGKGGDMIYFYWIVPEIAGALSFRRRSKLPGANDLVVVARAHGGDLYEERRPGGYAGLTDTITAGLDAVFCISEHGRSYLNAKYPALADRFHLARLGVNDPVKLNPPATDEVFRILSCSFMVPGKRIHLIIEAIAVLLAQHPDIRIRWTHIGDGELFEQLQSLVARRLADPRVEVVFKGYMTQPALMAYYQETAFDVIVNVSDSEGIPVSLMEASSVGIPMVATDVGGSGEIVNPANGILIDEWADASVIARALWPFHDRNHAAACREGARNFWNAHFNATTNYARFGDALRHCMERP